jgi:hypothetical protein
MRVWTWRQNCEAAILTGGDDVSGFFAGFAQDVWNVSISSREFLVLSSVGFDWTNYDGILICRPKRGKSVSLGCR